jgi:hypothetical protein
MGIRVRLVEGTPLTVGGKKLTPVVRAVSWNRRGAVVRQEGVSGFGAAAVWLQPVAVLDETLDGRRRIPIHDETARAVLSLLIIALAVPVILNLLVWLVKPRD